MRAIGLMSGTSLDGIDAVFVEVRPRGETYAVEQKRFATVPFAPQMHERLRSALPPHEATPGDLSALDGELGELFASAAQAIASGEDVDFVASHGLTAYHDGAKHATAQIGDPYRIRDALGASVVFDFRRADCAARGEGAPLVPYADALLLSDAGRDVVSLNLGGIANLTVLPRGGKPCDASAWDTGPANMLLDAFVQRRTAGRALLDQDGVYAKNGNVACGVVAALEDAASEYLKRPPPKSTGRERFGEHFLAEHFSKLDALSLEDACATLCAFTAATITSDCVQYSPRGARVIASGGGTRNPALVAMLRERLTRNGFELLLSGELGIDAAAKEAVVFTLLAYETLRGRPANVPAATGASRPVVLGAIVPHRLDALLEKVCAEVSQDDDANM